MKKLTVFVLVLFIIIALYGCTKARDPITDYATQELSESIEAESNEHVSRETITEAEETTEVRGTAENGTTGVQIFHITEKVTEKNTESDSDRVTDDVTVPLFEPITQSYLEMYEPMGMDLTDVTSYTVSDSEYSVAVIFEANGEITNFRICGVEMTYGYDEITETVLDIASLSDGEKIAVMMDFPGDMSSWYYSYTNNVGRKFECQIYMSGLDGSIVSTTWQ